MDNRPLAHTRYSLKGVTLDITDYASSDTPRIVAKELKKDCYNIESIRFAPGDVVMDIGANVGMVSIYIASEGAAAGDLVQRDAGGDTGVERLHSRGHRDRHDLVAGLSDQP